MRPHAVVATLLAASVLGQPLATEGSVDWAMNATIIDGCSCRMLCPCIFGSPATVGSAATHEHEGHRSCYFNAAYRVNKGHYGKVRLDGLNFWFAGDKGDAKTVELTFEPSATREQREGIREFLSHFMPLEWKSFTEGADARIEWKAEVVRAEAGSMAGKRLNGVDSIFRRDLYRYDSHQAHELLRCHPKRRVQYPAGRNTADRRGPTPAPFEFRGTSGWTLTIDMNSKDVIAARVDRLDVSEHAGASMGLIENVSLRRSWRCGRPA